MSGVQIITLTEEHHNLGLFDEIEMLIAGATDLANRTSEPATKEMADKIIRDLQEGKYTPAEQVFVYLPRKGGPAKVVTAEEVSRTIAFRALFKGHDRAFGRASIDNTLVLPDGTKDKPKSWTEKRPPMFEDWLSHLIGERSMGAVPLFDDDTAPFGALDIDSYGNLDHRKLAAYVGQHNLPVVVARSKSGGAHLFVFCQPGVPASVLRRWLAELRTALGLPAKTEVFPKQDSVREKEDGIGNWINLPFYNGWGHTTRYAYAADGKLLDFEQFLAVAESARRALAYWEQPFPAPAMEKPIVETTPEPEKPFGSPKEIWRPALGSRHNYIVQRIATMIATSGRDYTENSLKAVIDGIMDQKLGEQFSDAERQEQSRGFYKFGYKLLERAQRGKELETFTSDDVGNAERYTELYGHLVRYTPAFGKKYNPFYIWDTQRWSREKWEQARSLVVSLTEAMRTRVKDLGPEYEKICAKIQMKQALDEKERVAKTQYEGLVKQSKRLRHNAAQNDTVNQLVIIAKMIVTPEEFDRDPWLLNVENGTVDLRTGALREYRQEDMISRLANVRYVPGARSDLWDHFIDDITGGDREYASYLQMAFGMSLTGDTSEKSYFFCHGPTNTGKSTLTACFGRMLGDYALNIGFETLLTKPPSSGNSPRSDIARMQGARYVYASEVGRNRKFEPATIKMLAGYCDVITVRDMYAVERTFQPVLKLWLAANDRPAIDEDDDASWDRLHVLPFTRQWPRGEQDPELFEKLNTPEARSAMLSWSAQGCLKWQQAGRLGQAPKCVLVANTQYRQSMDKLHPFYEACCRFGKTLETPLEQLYGAWLRWAQGGATDEVYKTIDAFGGAMRRSSKAYDRGLSKSRKVVEDRKITYWSGIALQDWMEEDLKDATAGLQQTTLF